MTALAIAGMAAPALAKADEPCERETYAQPSGFVEQSYPIYRQQPFYGRDMRDNYWRMRERRRFERARRWEQVREHRYGRRW